MLPVLSADLRRAPTPFSLLPLALAPPPPPPPTLLRRRPLLLPRAISSSTSPPPVQEMEAAYKFGPYKIDAREVFHSTPLSYAMVNLRPLLPVCPKREVKRFADLSSNEISDLWVTAKEVGIRLEQYHKASSLTFAIQDGPQAGQTVPHVHIHVIPRKKGDFEKNDEIYDAIDVKERELKEKLDLDIERKDRTMKEMAHEANEYRVGCDCCTRPEDLVTGLRQIRSMTTTIAMTTATSTPGLTTRVNTSSPRLTGLDITPAFFLVIRAASSPLLPRILQLLMEKQPSILKLGLGEASENGNKEAKL
uniref:Bis(5'-adenosyl)-triphosphatase n=2 Tax=Oryza rufipogon TaxID=4529 RepID=A0A0E0R3H4_ORYRU